MKILDKLMNRLDRSIHDRGAPEELSYINRGSDRLVYKITNLRYGEKFKGKVVKIAKDSESAKNNILEKQFYDSIEDSKLKQEFCPILHCEPSGKFLIMDYVEPAPNNKKSLKFCKKMRSILPNSPDIHLQNIGIHEDLGYVIIDYPWRPEE